MSANSTIEWTDATWNPVRGCVKVSPGCKNCYANTFADRFEGVEGHAYELGFEPRMVPDMLAVPLGWTKQKTIFVNSMSDLFQDAVTDDYIEQCVRVMQLANWHTYQVLTKRATRLRDLLQTRLSCAASLPHIWWGVSVEDCKYGLPRIDALRDAPAPVRFLSVEPLIEDIGKLDLRGIHWVIVGGESGPGARPMDPAWVRKIRAQCDEQAVPFFFKQWGGVHKSEAGRILDGRTYDDMPPRENRLVASRQARALMIQQIEERAGIVSPGRSRRYSLDVFDYAGHGLFGARGR